MSAAVAVILMHQDAGRTDQEAADEGADDQTGTAQGPTDTARPANAAAHAGSHADSNVRQLEVHRVVTGLEDRFDAVIALQMVLFC